MLKLLKNFLKNNGGAIAVETAIVAPVVIMILLPAIDIGMQVHTKQRMNKATDSGIQYVVKGGRDEGILRNIVQDSYGKQLSLNDLKVTAYCACIVTGNNGGGDVDNGRPDQAFYVKTQTQLSEEMCPTSCTGGAEPIELVNIYLTQYINGTISEKQVASKMQTRMK